MRELPANTQTAFLDPARVAFDAGTGRMRTHRNHQSAFYASEGRQAAAALICAPTSTALYSAVMNIGRSI